MEQFKEKGGYIEAFIGVDAYGTSYEALLNLFGVCDELYIVHSERGATTFHSKIYTLSEGDDLKWVAVGSNNLTGGGLWTNFESAACFDISDSLKNCSEKIEELIAQYKDISYECSMMIQSKEDLDNLLDEDYIRKEIQIQLARNLGKVLKSENKNKSITGRFGKHTGIQIPKVDRTPKGAVIRNPEGQVDIRAIEPIVSTDAYERMWFETRSLTGGSRNILDLSMLGRVVSGSAKGTRYETNNNRFILGGIAFFDINSTNTENEKTITINYNGVDYKDCVIKFPVGDNSNGSWRIQLKGQSASGIKFHTIGGIGWLKSKIIVFEKVRTDYYVLMVLEENQLEAVKKMSKVVATNGSAKNSKMYGLL